MKHCRGLVVLAVCILTAHLHAAPSSKVSSVLRHQAEVKGPVRVLVILNTEGPTVASTASRETAKQLKKLASKQPGVGARANIDKRLAIKHASRNILQRLSGKISKVRQFNHFPLLRAEVDAAGLRALESSPEVVRVVTDRMHKPMLAQSVPLVEADITQTLGFRGQGQAVAVLDTGVDANHPFLALRVVEEACYSSTSSSTSTVCPNGLELQLGSGAAAPCEADGCSHGTHVAGISAGSGDGFAGVAPDASVIAVQVFSQVDSTSACLPGPAPCVTAFTSDIIAGLERVFDLRNAYNIAAVNLSLGGGTNTTFCDDDPMKTAIDTLREAGIASIIASGNDGETNAISSPACISSAISVGATTKADEVSSFSNSTTFLTLLAPGSQINSSVTGGGFGVLSGTSMAAPHVAGAFAVIRSAAPQASVAEIVRSLAATGLPVTDSRNQLVKPRIRLNQALSALGNGGDAELAVEPLNGLASGGEPGGPFTPNSVIYTLRNNGIDPLSFDVSTSQTWLSVVPSNGSILAGGSTEVTLSLTAAAAELFPGTYSTSVLFNNTAGSSGDTLRTATLTVQGAGSANDKFSNAALLTVDSGSTLGSNRLAGRESAEPAHAGLLGGASIWWQWVAPANGAITIDTGGSDFDTLLGVYTGARISALSGIASNDDFAGTSSSVTFNVAVGTNYLIAVDGFRSASGVATGNVVLNWRFSEDSAGTGSLAVTPVEGLFASGTLGGPFSPTTKTYTLTNTSAGLLGFDILTNGLFVDAGTRSGQLAAGASTTIEVSLNSGASTLGPGTSIGSVIVNGISRIVAVTVEANGLAQDDFANRTIISDQLPQTLLSTNTQTTKEAGEPAHAGQAGGASVWWSWTAPVDGTVIIDTAESNFDTLLSAYTGDAVTDLTEIASSDDILGLQSRISFAVTAGQIYAIAVDGFAGATGSISLNLDSRFGRPAGDDFDDAQEIAVGLSFNDTLLATTEIGEPPHSGVVGGKSVWWRWQATGGEQITIDTRGSDFDTLLAVYTGDSLATLTEVISNDDTNGLQSEVTFAAIAGTVYHIAVDGFIGAAGSARLNIRGAGLVEKLVTSTLPTSRSVRVGDAATVFATVINTSSQAASGCMVNADIDLPASFSFLQTNALTNFPLVGTEGKPFELAAGEAQTLILVFTASQPLGPIDVPLLFRCDNIGAARIISGLNTILLSASNNIVADIVALAATLTDLGVVLAGQSAPGAFSVATVNLGATEVITAAPNATFLSPSVGLSICQTDSVTGACLSPPAPSVIVSINANETPTFSVFVSPAADIAFAPDEFRVQVVFSDPAGNVRGSTSVAVSTSLP